MAKKPSYKELDAEVKGLRKELEIRRKTAEELKFLKEYTESLIENANVVVMTASPQGKVTYFNRKAEKLFEYSRGEVLGKSYKILHSEDQLDQVKFYFNQIAKGRDLVDTEIPCVTKDGRLFTISMNTTSVRDSTGKTTLIAIGQDVTEKKRLIGNIEESKKEWETIFDSIAEGVFMVDDAYIIRRANRGLATLLKRNVQEIVGRRCYELIHGLSKIPKMCPRPLVVKHRSPQSAEMWEPYLKRHLSIYYYPLVDEDGSVRKVIHLIRDITEKKKTEQDLKSRVSELATLYEFGLKVISTLDTQKLLGFVTDTMCKTVGAGECSIFLWDNNKKILALKSSSYVSHEQIHEQIDKVKIPLGEGITGWIAANRSVVNLKDMKSDPRYEDRYGLIKRFFPKKRVSYLGIPLILGDKLLGVLSLLDKKDAPKFSTFDQSLTQSMANQLSLALENSSLYQMLKESYLGNIRSLASAVEVRDPYTKGHSDDVARYSVMIAKALGLSYEEIELIEFAGILHDVGKIAIPRAILEKPSFLNPKEWNNVKRHPSLSRQLLLPIKPLAKIVPWVYHHHERYDGKGYVDRLKGDDIPLGARILAVADTYSAMTSERPYRRAKDREEALEELKRVAGTQLDPMIVKVFIEQLTQSHQ